MADSARSVGKSAIAIVVLVVAVALLLKLAFGVIAGILGFLFWVVVVGVVVAALIWAARVLF